MTKETISETAALKALLSETADHQILAEMLGFVADRLMALDGTGFDLVEISGELGQASAFKMTYAALTKGTNALLTNVMLAAQANGFLDQFKNEIKASQSVLEARARTNIPLLPADAARWQDEMQQIARHFDDLGLPPDFHLGARIVMEILAQSVFGHETRRTRRRCTNTGSSGNRVLHL